ncbi:MAG TPA: hypothetical protein VF071_04495 [Candidatus Limnocylindria bacterium]
MNAARPTAELDPRSFVEAPVIAALNGIVVRAVVGFSVVAAFASVPLIARLEDPVHDAFHLLLPIGAVGYSLITGALLLLRPAPPVSDAWAGAAEVDPALARFARRVSIFMIVGWLAAVGAVLVHHHLSSPDQVLMTVLVDVPLTLAVWLAAVFAWTGWCRATLARAQDAAAHRLRRYWSEVPRSRQAP